MFSGLPCSQKPDTIIQTKPFLFQTVSPRPTHPLMVCVFCVFSFSLSGCEDLLQQPSRSLVSFSVASIQFYVITQASPTGLEVLGGGDGFPFNHSITRTLASSGGRRSIPAVRPSDNLIEARVIWEEKTSMEKMPPSDCP